MARPRAGRRRRQEKEALTSKTSMPRRLARQVLYRDPWVNLMVDKVELPTGHLIQRFHLLDYDTSAVGALVFDRQGRLLLERIARYSTGTVGWELPAGGVEKGESPAAAAQREVFEETGYRTTAAKQLYSYFPMNGSANKVFHLVRMHAMRQEGEIDPNEVLEIGWFRTAELWQLVERGEIHDGLTLSGLLFIARRLQPRQKPLRPRR